MTPPKKPAKKTPAKRVPRKAAADNVFEIRPADPKPKNKAQQRRGTSPRTIAVAQRRERAVALRLSGASFLQIADAITSQFPGAFPNYDNKSASEDVRESLARIRVENVGDYLAESVARLDSYLIRLSDRIRRGDVEAINSAVRIEKRRADLLGLDADKRVRLLGPDGGPIEVEHQFADDDESYDAALRVLDEIAPPIDPKQIEA